MDKLKTILAFLVCLMFILSLAGCKERPPEVKKYKTEVVDMPSEKPAPETEAAPEAAGADESQKAEQLPAENIKIISQNIIHKGSTPKTEPGSNEQTITRKKVDDVSIFSNVVCNYQADGKSTVSFALENPSEDKVSLEGRVYETGYKEINSLRVWVDSKEIKDIAAYCSSKQIEAGSKAACKDVPSEKLKKGMSPWGAVLKNELRAESLKFGSAMVFVCE